MTYLTERIKKHINAMRWRGKLQPVGALSSTYPVPMTSTQCRALLTHLFETGRSSHTAHGATLWAVLDFLQSAKVPYTLYACPGHAYEVSIDPSDTKHQHALLAAMRDCESGK